MKEELIKKVNRAVKLLQTFAGNDVVEVSFSGGKDSEVILQLAKMAGIKYRAIYKATTIDPKGTPAHCKSKGVEIIHPKETFFKLIERMGFPNRFARFCCATLKEYKVLSKAVHGVRRAESTARSKRYKEPMLCRYYGKKTPENHVQICLPLLEWTDDDVKTFIETYKIKCHPLYYDALGNFHVSRRLGCVGCPLATIPKRLEAFKQYPKYVKLWIEAGGRFLETHPQTKSAKRWRGDKYAFFYANLIYRDLRTFYEKDRPDLWGNRPDYKSLLEKYFNIKL